MKISPKQYAEALVALSKEDGDVTRMTESFVGFLRKRRATRYLTEIVREAERHADRLEGRIRVLAETATEVGEEQKREIKRVVGEAFPGTEPVIRYVVKPELLGGVRLSSDSETIDATVVRRLREMERTLKCSMNN
jgi:F0F1-type ATP synthase delta subunit